MRKNKIVLDLSKKSPEEVYDILQALLFVRYKLTKNGFSVNVKRTYKKKKTIVNKS